MLGCAWTLITMRSPCQAPLSGFFRKSGHLGHEITSIIIAQPQPTCRYHSPPHFPYPSPQSGYSYFPNSPTPAESFACTFKKKKGKHVLNKFLGPPGWRECLDKI